MKKKLAVWLLIRDSLEKNIPVMLLYVLESRGSSPGRQGFFMAVTAEGEMEGSIGGGIMEHKFVEMAKERLRTQQPQHQEVRKQIHNKSAPRNQSGMICSGEQTLWIYPVQAKDAASILQIIHCLHAFGNGTLTLSPGGIGYEPVRPDSAFSLHFVEENDWVYREALGYSHHLYIIGGGHCALAFSRLMRTMDFYIHLFDDREGLRTMEQNEAAHEKKVVQDYSELATLVPPGGNTFVVIMTLGYRTDDRALRSLMGRDFRYLGLLGSKKKIEKMFADYRKKGVDEAVLQSIHAPVGLPIKSETPEEIAVSIAAEIIRVKNA